MGSHLPAYCVKCNVILVFCNIISDRDRFHMSANARVLFCLKVCGFVLKMTGTYSYH